MDETGADDEALYAVWRNFSAEEVAAYFERLSRLYRAFSRLRGADPPPALVAEARDLSTNGLALGYLPALRAILAEGFAP
jgi:hypothetical protein